MVSVEGRAIVISTATLASPLGEQGRGTVLDLMMVWLDNIAANGRGQISRLATGSPPPASPARG